MKNRVSIIIPVFNCEQFLPDCIKSVLLQTYKNLEIILVDDGSTDLSPKICKDFSSAYGHIKVVHQENNGVSVARNVGKSLSKGDFIFFLDADDMLYPNAIEVLLNEAIKTNADMTVGLMSKNETHSLGTFSGETLLLMSLNDISITYSACRILFKRSFISDIMFEENRVCSEDSFFVFKCSLKKPTITIIEDIVYFYRDNTDSVTHSYFSRKKYDDIVYFLNEKENIILKHFPHLTKNFYNLKARVQMQLLFNILKHPQNEFSLEEKTALKTFYKHKKHFDKNIPYNKKIYFIFNNHLYYFYKIFYKIMRKIK